MNSLLYFLGIVVVLACILFTLDEPSKTQKIACYDLSYRSEFRADTYFIDRCQGRVWQLNQFTGMKDKPMAWEEMPIIDRSLPADFWVGLRIRPEQFNEIYSSEKK
jgi:hypothetical protein